MKREGYPGIHSGVEWLRLKEEEKMKRRNGVRPEKYICEPYSDILRISKIRAAVGGRFTNLAARYAITLCPFENLKIPDK